jgi:hypothetical protein
MELFWGKKSLFWEILAKAAVRYLTAKAWGTNGSTASQKIH